MQTPFVPYVDSTKCATKIMIQPQIDQSLSKKSVKICAGCWISASKAVDQEELKMLFFDEFAFAASKIREKSGINRKKVTFFH